MVVISALEDQVVRETEQRYAERAELREEHRSEIEGGHGLAADATPRVNRRLARLGVTREEADPVFLERLFGENNLVDVSFLELALWVARTVGRIVERTAVGGLRAVGTGFMVSPHLLLTNNHVVRNAAQAAGSLVEMNYQHGADGRLLSSHVYRLDPDKFFLTDRDLDYSLVAVQPGDHLGDFGWNHLIAEEGKVIVGEALNVVEHPDGEPKKLALRENRLIDVLENYLHYESDTAGGASGSPVYNDQWEVVALHHSGAPRRDAEGRILSKTGEIWSRDMGEQQIDWIGNEGIRISRLIAHVQEQTLATSEQRGLRSELFEALPPPPGAPSPSA